MDDVIRWIEGDVDDDQVEAIARGLCLVTFLDNLPSLLSQVTHPAAYAPAMSIVALSIALPGAS